MLSLPYVKYDILPSTFYANCTFSFKSPKALRQFAGADETDIVVKVRIEYGKLSRCHHTDGYPYYSNILETGNKWRLLGRQTGGESILSCLNSGGDVFEMRREASNSRVEKSGKWRKTGVFLRYLEDINLSYQRALLHFSIRFFPSRLSKWRRLRLPLLSHRTFDR
jgi:hypothetical protein